MICERCKNPELHHTMRRCNRCGADPVAELEFAAFHRPLVKSVQRLILAIGSAYPAVVLAAFGWLAYVSNSLTQFATFAFERAIAIAGMMFLVHIALYLLARTAPVPAIITAASLYVLHVATLYLWGYTLPEALIAEVAIVALLGAGIVASVRAHRVKKQVIVQLRELRELRAT